MDIAIGKRLFGLVLVFALCTSALIAIGILPLGEFDEMKARILVTTGLIGFFSAATYRLAFTLRGTPSEAAVEEARRALVRGGAKVEKVDRLR